MISMPAPEVLALYPHLADVVRLSNELEAMTPTLNLFRYFRTARAFKRALALHNAQLDKEDAQ